MDNKIIALVVAAVIIVSSLAMVGIFIGEDTASTGSVEGDVVLRVTNNRETGDIEKNEKDAVQGGKK